MAMSILYPLKEFIIGGVRGMVFVIGPWILGLCPSQTLPGPSPRAGPGPGPGPCPGICPFKNMNLKSKAFARGGYRQDLQTKLN